MFHAIITNIYDNHIKFEVSLHSWRIWPTVQGVSRPSYIGAFTLVGVFYTKTSAAVCKKAATKYISYE